MPKRSPHPHVSWRGGRPRFSPGPDLRAAGHKSFDLRHDDGRWFSFGEAIDWSRKFRSENGLDAPPSRRPISMRADEPPAPARRHPARKGYIYFLRIGDRLKIGFSTKPVARLQALSTGFTDPFDAFVSVPGTQADEKRLHQQLSGHRTRGEWFRMSLSVKRIVQRHIEALWETKS